MHFLEVIISVLNFPYFVMGIWQPMDFFLPILRDFPALYYLPYAGYAHGIHVYTTSLNSLQITLS